MASPHASAIGSGGALMPRLELRSDEPWPVIADPPGGSWEAFSQSAYKLVRDHLDAQAEPADVYSRHVRSMWAVRIAFLAVAFGRSDGEIAAASRREVDVETIRRALADVRAAFVGAGEGLPAPLVWLPAEGV